MPYQLTELIHRRVFYQKVDGEYTTQELNEVSVTVRGWLDKANHEEVILIVDVSDVTTLPSNVFDLQKAVKPIMEHPNLIEIITFGKGDTIGLQFLVNNVLPLFQSTPFKLVNNYQQVIEYFTGKYPDLADKLPSTRP